MTRTVTVIGAGPAGSAAAIAARMEGAPVVIHEKSKFPRHKVCGEFLSPEIAPLLDKLGVWSAVEQLNPARYSTLVLRFLDSAGELKHSKTTRFAQRPYGLSRFSLDRLLMDRAAALGAEVQMGGRSSGSVGKPVIIAHGRQNKAPRSTERLFGFKAHFTGPVTDSVELYFFRGGYLGVNSVEGGLINVCGLARESVLAAVGFDIEALLARIRVIQSRVESMRLAAPWMHAGPLVYRGPREAVEPGTYPAGDALSFIDPFTGTGILTGVLTGSLAGRFAAAGRPCEEYLKECRRSIAPALLAARAFRSAVFGGWGGTLARLIPGRLLVAATRPRARV